MDAKAVKHGLRVELIGARPSDRGVWHVLERSPRGVSNWYVHRWIDVAEYSKDGLPTGTVRREWQTLDVKPADMIHASLACHPTDLMAYPATLSA